MSFKAKTIVPKENISVKEFYNSFKSVLALDIIAGENGMENIIREKSINRPSLALTGYFKNFAFQRLQLFGNGEMSYYKDLDAEKKRDILDKILDFKIPAMVISRKLAADKIMIDAFNRKNITLFVSSLSSKDFTAQSAVLLSSRFAPKTMMHGTLMDVKGIGVLIRGKSGVGKSECALALVEKGHSIVSDDITYIDKFANKQLFGKSNEINRGFMECRGIGIINVAELFGIRSVRKSSRIDMVITFLEWSPDVIEERIGLDENHIDILDVKIPHIEIPVRPGRDMARLVEVAALVQALKNIGHNSAADFNKNLIAHMQNKPSI